MTKRKRLPSKSKSSSDNDLVVKPYMIVLSIILLCISIFIGFYLHTTHKIAVPISVFAIIAGVLFESKRLSDKWEPIIVCTLLSFIFSFLIFLPGKRDHDYHIENHIFMWPFAFIIIFSLMSIAFHGNKVTAKLTEGITLLQSIAIVYWFFGCGFVHMHNWFAFLIMGIGLIFVLLAVLNAFTYIHLSRTNRLILSIWSSIIMMLFALDNIIRTFHNKQIEKTSELSQGLYIALQYFLLGVSLIYIIKNLMMLAGFLPRKNKFFNKEYYDAINKLKNEHIERYSEHQVHILHSLLCVILAGSVFTFNYYYHILPGNLIIWIMFILFPYIIVLLDYALIRTSNKNELPEKQ